MKGRRTTGRELIEGRRTNHETPSAGRSGARESGHGQVRWRKGARGGMMKRNVAIVLSVVFVLLLAAGPANACFGSSYYSYQGIPCDWDGTHEHWDYDSPSLDTVGGATGIQDGYSYWCDMSRLKLYWRPYGGVNTLSYFYGLQGVNPGPQDSGYLLYYSDHDVRRTDDHVWFGWRLYHNCP